MNTPITAHDFQSCLSQLDRSKELCEEECYRVLGSLGDLLEYSDWSSLDLGAVFAELVDLATSDVSREIVEVTMNTLVIAALRYPKKDWLREQLPRILSSSNTLQLDMLPYTIELVGLSGDRSYQSHLEKWAKHRSETIAQSASEALIELNEAFNE